MENFFKYPCKIIIAALAIFTDSCKNSNPSKNNEQNRPDKADLVRYCYDKAFKLQLPFIWQNTKGGLPIEKSKILRPSNGDSVLFGSGTGYTTPILGTVPDTSNFFIFLSTYTGDDIMPVLYVFDKRGNKKSSEILGYSCGGADCGFYCMNGIFIWENSNSFYSTQEAYTVNCDPDLDTRDTSTLEFIRLRTKGQINKKGEIVFDKEETMEKRKVDWHSEENPYTN
ncbi:MAG TPA: hypothetical protein VEC12_10705 [Bacteroidia bacterium]|nr:hypothetical protein [Bacteroidia bacterium]